MPGLTLYSGNRLEILADKFAGTVSLSPLPVMTKESIVLQSMGMMKWLTVEMSRRLGIWSNYEYIFPNKMVGNILNSFLPGKGSERFFDKDIMTWRCAGLILQEKSNPSFSELASYIKDDSTGLKLYQISSKIVDLYDQYMTFRPEMINAWDKGEDFSGWQSDLWRKLTGGMNGDHPPALLYEVYNILKSGDKINPVNLPGRITVFGISYLPMYHLNILRAASLYSDVNLFILNPSSEYWGNILTEKEKRRIISTSPILPGDPEDYLHIEQGNVLLASLGRVGRDFLFNIFMSDLDTVELFEEPERKSLLSMIQNDIYTMNNGNPGSGKFTFSEDEISKDNSIIINSCHSSMREVEVLHDYILELLDKDKTLAPGDILVMSPDIEEYSSSIQGIFGRSSEGLPRIPFRIVDRKLKNTSAAIETFFKVLSIGDERFTSSSLLGIADCDEVRDRFNLTHEDMDKVGRWVRETAIFWGIDPDYKKGLGLPGIYENTWEFGLKRMLMGGIMSCEEQTSMGTLPYSGIEGGDLQILGRFITLFNSLREIYYMLNKDYTLTGWSEVITFIIDSLFVDEEIPESLISVSAAAVKIRNLQSESLFTEKVSLSVIKEYLDKAVSESGSGKDFVSGSLTFCEMLPMRSIPGRVICILGMNDSAFPRKSRALSFDLTSESPKRGDRSVRDEDRYLFLETLVSARDNLYLSYTGQSLSSNNLLNPSVVISELIEYINEFYDVENSVEKTADYIFKTHRIQPYNPVYFLSGSGFFTYQGSRVGGARSYAMSEKSDYRFMDKPLPPLSDKERSAGISELAAFLINPLKALMNKRLGLYLGLRSDEYIEEEPFTPDFLDQYKLNSAIMDSLIKGGNRESHFELVKAAGDLPHSTPGEITYDRSFTQVKNFYDRFSYLLKDKMDRVIIDLDIDGFNLTGTVDNIYGGGAVFFRYASAKGMDLLSAWITHLALCDSGNFHGDTRLISKNGNFRWKHITGSREILLSLIEVYEEGMTKPVPLFPKSSLKFAETFFDGKKGEPGTRAFKAASSSFRNSFYGGDSDDPYIQKFFGDSYALSDQFRKFTLKVYTPLFENINMEAEI
jgi:exodeoxyribonuclease V gamma subunit